ncbi:MAG: DUF3025 domain-containing protein [Casimicrobiaceae bacterium]
MMTGVAVGRAPSRLHPALAAIARRFGQVYAREGLDIVDFLTGEAQAVPSAAALDTWAKAAGVEVGEGLPLRFVAPEERMGALAYERRIHARGEVGTRPGDRHDACNALSWLMLPATKAALTAIHCHGHGTAQRGSAGRGPARDAATLLDEFGVIVLSTRPDLVAAWRAHAWHALFHACRDEVARDLRIVVLGHGLIVALARPFPSLTAKALVIELPALPHQRPAAGLDGPVDGNVIAAADAVAAGWLRAAMPSLGPATLLPLPVMAWPGWSTPDPHGARFADTRIFRPLRHHP